MIKKPTEIWLRGWGKKKKKYNIIFLHEKLSQHAKLRTIWRWNINEEGLWKYNYNNWPRNNRIYKEQHKQCGPEITQTPISCSAYVWELERFPYLESHFNQSKRWSGINAHPEQWTISCLKLYRFANIREKKKKGKKTKFFTRKCSVTFSESKFLLEKLKWQWHKHERKPVNGRNGVEREGI